MNGLGIQTAFGDNTQAEPTRRRLVVCVLRSTTVICLCLKKVKSQIHMGLTTRRTLERRGNARGARSCIVRMCVCEVDVECELELELFHDRGKLAAR